MIMENLGNILLAAGFLLVVAALFISMNKAGDANEDGQDFPEMF